ncbi:MAG: pyridoxamine 5'-phosphate oxidase family protein [Candidatus Heimdallarchaeota archaeon]|nr:MAG: pyridoxamine 5'-phosphate oxidase family protein [Candidatus Heimdallarchaeota archaeon]
MQPPKKYKFLQEQVFEGIWPFNKLKSPVNVFLLLLLYFFWGLGLYFIYEIPMSYFIAGSCGALGLFLWTIGIFHYADSLRNVEVERITKVNQKFLVGFLENLFHPSSLVISVVVFTFVVTYFFTSQAFGIENFLFFIQKEMNWNSVPPLLLLYVLLLTFDLCYRLGLSFYVIIVQIRRNFRLAQYLKTPILKTQFSSTDIRNLEKTDYIHYLAIVSGFTLIPLGLMDPVLFVMLCTYLVVTIGLTTVNILHLRLLYERSIPDGLLSLIRSTKFAQVGTISPGNFPHITPTLFVFDGRNFFIATSIKSQKVKNLHRLKDIAIFIDSRKDGDITKDVGVLITGRSRIYGHDLHTGILNYLIFGLHLFRIYLLFKKKYLKYISEYWKIHRRLPQAWQLLPILSRTFIEIVPEQFFLWKASRTELIKL